MNERDVCALGRVLDSLGALLGCSWVSLDPLGVVLGPRRPLLKLLWATLAALEAVLDPLAAVFLGGSWLGLGSFGAGLKLSACLPLPLPLQ